eukprot:1142829-Pelagomonas_calceolata.AAC.4
MHKHLIHFGYSWGAEIACLVMIPSKRLCSEAPTIVEIGQHHPRLPSKDDDYMSLACRCTWAPRGENRMSLSKKITCHWHADALGLLE